MRLTLEVRAFCNQPADDRQRNHFDNFPVIVGRSSACHYCLEDASRYISSNHAVISLEDGQLYISDTSANGVYVNSSPEPVGRGRSQRLEHADTLAIGDYTLSVSIDTGSQNATAEHSAFDADDPFADFASSPTKAVLPDEAAGYDPFRGSEPDWTPPSTSTDDPFAGDWDLDGQSASPKDQPISNSDSDWADWPDEPAQASPSSAKAPQTPQTRQAPVRATPPPAAASRGTGALDTLLRAAALRESDFDQRQEAEILEQTGKLLTQMVDAMMVLLQSRTELKNAIRSDVTTLARNDNNPLKFSYDATDALTKMLSSRNDGYMEPERAIEQAVEDLKLHQLAMLEGMKSAVRAVLTQFDPDKLSKHLEKTGGISANIPITREAKLWELFCEQYEGIREEAMNDFTEVYGREFRKAYESRIRKTGRTPDF